ncbi:hypothetical protein CSUI_001636 [Cystoisospora suis]|uniref:Transmembrane protein n=1 Tax=Cystoisospora suis TaxID=483139 RepID=A0A2C6KKD7_9APIC|nr:hypothetical protein CSUI_001636 [Cystoisospora suis]
MSRLSLFLSPLRSLLSCPSSFVFFGPTVLSSVLSLLLFLIFFIVLFFASVVVAFPSSRMHYVLQAPSSSHLLSLSCDVCLSPQDSQEKTVFLLRDQKCLYH